ncbi:MAG: sugar ABC transporter substrate-binding protein [Firmicutes bacterium]|nr:sugar ABC transporter substrate-binding protein [Bacillota bacterium]
MKKLVVLMLCLVMFFSVVVIGEAAGSTPKKISYAIPGLTGPIWNAAGEGFIKQAEEFGWNATIIDPNDNLEQQISMIKNRLITGMEGLIITPIDGQAVGPLMIELSAEDIPVVAIDRQVEGPVISTVEADNLKIGIEMGKLFIKSLGNKKSEVLIVGGPLSSSATVNRTDGFKATLEGHSNITIVGESATEFDNEVALAVISNYIQANPNINCIFSCTDTLLPAVMTALDESDKLHPVGEVGHVFVYSVDGDGYGLTQVVEGKVDATYGLDPYEWAASAVKALKDYYDGKKVEKSILITGRIVTKENFEELKADGVLWGAASME